MTTTATKPDLSRFCNNCARAAGLDTAGSAYSYEHVLAAEIPLPWPVTMYDTAGVLPQELVDFRAHLIESYRQGNPLSVGTFAIAPDPAYAVPGYRRVISYRRPEGPFARYGQTEYLVSDEYFGPLCWALLVAHDRLDQFAHYRQPSSDVRDFMVCTHGAVDAACAKFGFPLYRQMRQIAEASDGRIRAWRVSHFGGHVFAPTVIEMPEFRYWGYIEHHHAEQLIHRVGDTASVRHCLRGWAGFDNPYTQTAERELFVRHGWAWLDYLKRSEVLDQDANADEPAWTDVRIHYQSPDGTVRGMYAARVELTGKIETIHTTGETGTWPHPQYATTRLEQVE